MEVTTLHHYLQEVHPYLNRYGYGAVFVIVFLEGFGIPAPGQTIIMAAGLLASRGQMDIGLVVLVAWSAAVLGDNTGYAIGHYGEDASSFVWAPGSECSRPTWSMWRDCSDAMGASSWSWRVSSMCCDN